MSEERAAKRRECVKRWKLANPEKVKAQYHRHYVRHRDKKLAYSLEYKRRIKDKARKYDELTGGAEE